MVYLIDGHNCIGSGALPGVTLADEDDEAQLVSWVRARRDRLRGKITIVFDSGIPGGRSASLSGGGVEVLFARQWGGSADRVILDRLHQQQRKSGVRVVTADRTLVNAAQALGAQVIPPADFVRQLTRVDPAPEFPDDEAPHVRQTPEEVEEWLRLFTQRKPRKRRHPPKR